MRRATTTIMGLMALVVTLVLGVFSAGSASAQTLYLFLVTGPLPALVLLLNDNDQIFKVEANSELRIICKHFGGFGLLSNGSAMWGSTGKINGKYSKCNAEPGNKVTTVSEAEYEVNAQGSVTEIGRAHV